MREEELLTPVLIESCNATAVTLLYVHIELRSRHTKTEGRKQERYENKSGNRCPRFPVAVGAKTFMETFHYDDER